MSEHFVRLKTALAGRYEIDREIGSGGMATVYLGADVRHHRNVAIKLLRSEFDVAGGRDRFLREIEILGQLRHPHILPLLDSGAIDDLCFFVMPHCEGETLRVRLVRDGVLPIDEAVQYASEIADALTYAHAHGVIHRDVKPQNVMLESGHAVLADFGIALAVDNPTQERLTSKSHSLGSPHYMSPEQASSSDTIDGRSDIYSLGCVTYEMLVGEPPFKGPSLLAVIARHAVEPPPRIRTVRDTVSPALEHVVQRALAKAPADRFSTAQDMRSALIDVQNEQVLQDGASVFAIGAARRPRLALWLRIAAGIAGALALLFVCGLLTIAAFDARVQMPIRFTPSTTNFLLMGARAFVVPAFVAAVILMTLVALRYALSVFNAGMVSLPIVGQGLDTMEQRAETLLSRFRLRFSRRTIYEAFFLASLASAVLVLYAFAPLFQPVYAPEVSILGCLHRDEHRIVQPAISALIVAIVYVWWRLSRREAGRRTGERTAFPHWRIATLVVLLIIAMTLPWRMTWLGGTERVRIGEDRGYLLHETDTELVIYNADRKVTTVFPKGDDSTVQRLAVQGYIFEEASVFESGIPECYSVTSTPLPGSVP